MKQKAFMLTDNNIETVVRAMKRNPEKTNVHYSKRFGVSESSISRLRRKYDLLPARYYGPMKKPHGESHLKDSTKQRIIRIKNTIKSYPEYTIGEIAVATNIPKSTVQHLIQNNNITYESKKETDLTIYDIDPQTIQQMIYKYPDKTIAELSELIGYSQSNVRRYLNKNTQITYKQKKKKGNTSTVDINELRRTILSNPEYTMQDIATSLNANKSTIHRLINDHDLPYTKKNATLNAKSLENYIVNNKNKPVSQIAKHFKKSESQIRRLIKKHKIPYIPKN